MNVCEAGHKTHATKLVDTVYGYPMEAYDWDQYQGYAGYCTGQDDTSRTILNTGGWEPIEAGLAHEILLGGNREDLVVDLGAHIGWYSLLALSLGYPVYAYEGDAENCATLHRNVARLGWDTRITVECGWVDLSTATPTDGPVRLWKADIEGVEPLAVAAHDSLFREGRVEYALVEVSPVFNDLYPTMVDWILWQGYEAFYADGQTLATCRPFDHDWTFPQTNLIFRRIP